ncbi:MAG: class I SAM-dependent methyltransferase [Terriglobia bacterium]
MTKPIPGEVKWPLMRKPFRKSFFLEAILQFAGCILLLLLAGSLFPAPRPEIPQIAEGPSALTGKLAPYVPTPLGVCRDMLTLAQVNRFDRVYDLGSGDGRIVIMAAEMFGAEAVGVELDDPLYEQSSQKVLQLGLQSQVRIVHANFFKVNLRPATVVTLYLLRVVNAQLRPVLERQLRPGARIVSHDFPVPGWKPERVETVEGDYGATHTLYLYVRPQAANSPPLRGKSD